MGKKIGVVIGFLFLGILFSFGIAGLSTYVVGRQFFGVFEPSNCPPFPSTLEERIYYPTGCGWNQYSYNAIVYGNYYPYDFLGIFFILICVGLIILFSYLAVKYYKSLKRIS